MAETLPESHFKSALAPRRLDLNAYLLRSGYDPSVVLTESSVAHATMYIYTSNQVAPLSPDLIGAAAIGDIVVTLLSRPTGIPAWQAFLTEALGLTGFMNAADPALGAAIFTAVPDPSTGELRWVAWCFGTASRSLRKQATEPRFGLLVVLNGLDEGKLRQLRHRTPAPYTQQTDHRAARDQPVDGFRIDRLIDLINGVGGAGTVGEFHCQLVGAKGIRFRREVTGIDFLGDLAIDLMASFRREGYREQFPWIDNYVLVEDEALVLRLREEVYDLILADPSGLDVLLPDENLAADDLHVIDTVVFPHKRSDSACDLVMTTDMVAKYLARQDPSALDHTLRFLDESGQEMKTATILECLAAELAFEGQRYVLYDGDFYAVDGEFLDRINAEIRAVPLTTLDLPPYLGHDEGHWNETVARERPDILCLDKKLVYLPGHTPFEPCDLLTTGGAFIHAKRVGQASKMTYVFTQAVEACELLVQVEEARQKLEERVRAADPARKRTTRAVIGALESLSRRPPDNEVVIALLGDWPTAELTRLPLLVKLSLLGAFKQLRLMGFRPTVAMVPLGSRRLAA